MSIAPAPPAPSTRPVLRLAAVHVRRGATAILRGIDLAFEPQHRHVIIGASGSGKSTLIRLLNRLDDPDSGTITLGAVPLASWPVLELRGRIGLVLQSPRPLPGTLGDNLTYPRTIAGRPAPERSSLQGVLAEVGLDPAWLDRDAAVLSGGERQRLAIAVALARHPEILILDEPTAALDPSSARQVADLLARATRSHGLRTIVVTHDRSLAPHLGDHGVRLDGGIVADEGPIRDVLHRADPTEATA